MGAELTGPGPTGLGDGTIDSTRSVQPIPAAPSSPPDDKTANEMSDRPADTSDYIVSEIDIGGSSSLHNSPVAAQNVIYNFGDSSVEQDPTIEFQLKDIELDTRYAYADIDALVAQLMTARLLFVAFEGPLTDSFESLRSQLLHALGPKDYAYRTTTGNRPLDFNELHRRSSRYTYKTTTVLSLPNNTIRNNLDYLTRPEMRFFLQRRLAAANIYLITPVTRNEVPKEFDAVTCQKGGHLLVLESTVDTPTRPNEEFAQWNDSDAVINTLNFILVFFPRLTRREVNTTVEALLRSQQTLEHSGLAPPTRLRFPSARLDDVTRWMHSQDQILLQGGIVHHRNESGKGGYMFADPKCENALRVTFLEIARNWSARQLEAVLDLLFKSTASTALQLGTFELVVTLHEHLIHEVEPAWLWEIFAQHVVPDTTGSAFFQFERLLHHLLRAPACKVLAIQFLHDLATRCKSAADEWLAIFCHLEAVRSYLGATVRPLAQLQAFNELIEIAVDSLNADQLAPLQRLGEMQGLIIRAMTAVPASGVMPCIINALTETPEQQRCAEQFKDLPALALVARPSVMGMYLGLCAYLGQASDLLCEFGTAILSMHDAAGSNQRFSTAMALTVLLDALHQSTFDAATRCNGDLDEEAREFIGYFLDAEGNRDFPAVLARSTAMRSPQRNRNLVVDDPPLLGTDIRASVRLYEELCLSLYKLEGGMTGDLRSRVKALVAPFANGLALRRRGELRQCLRDREAFFRSRKVRFDAAGNRDRSRDELRRIDLARLMLAAMP